MRFIFLKMFFCLSTDRIFMQVKGGKAALKTIPKTQKTLKAEVEKSKQKSNMPLTKFLLTNCTRFAIII